MRVVESAFDSKLYDLLIGRLEEHEHGDLDETLASARRHGYSVVFVRCRENDRMHQLLETRVETPLDVLCTSKLTAARPLQVKADDRIVVDHKASIHSEHTLDEIAALAAEAFTTSHLHADPRLPIENTRRLFSTWARNDATGRGARTFVASAEGMLVGFLTVVMQKPTTAMIDLVAVSPRAQNRGIGTRMLGAFIAWVDANNYVATVGTQRDNPALALYKRAGFEPVETHVTYHLWLS